MLLLCLPEGALGSGVVPVDTATADAPVTTTTDALAAAAMIALAASDMAVDNAVDSADSPQGVTGVALSDSASVVPAEATGMAVDKYACLSPAVAAGMAVDTAACPGPFLGRAAASRADGLVVDVAVFASASI